ncbi:retrovirus-related pol polyprotein from transposon TNT 1-94 [Tanacetum coccineum]
MDNLQRTSNVPVPIPDHLICLIKDDFESWQHRFAYTVRYLIHYKSLHDAKDIWDNVKMLLEGLELTKEDRESQLYDDFEHFRQNKGETIHDYYVWFAKLINDMRNIKMTMSKIQLNLKFVNNMLPEWDRFVTAVKLNKGLKDSNFDQLYAYLKIRGTCNTRIRSMLERLNNRQLGQGNNARGAGAVGYGIAQNRVGNANPGQARQDNAIDEDVDEQPVQDLALNVDNVFQANDCDAYNSDVDEAPMAQTMFIANLSSADPVCDEAGSSYDSDILSEVHDHDHYQDAVCDNHEEHEMHDNVQPNHVVDSHADYTSNSKNDALCQTVRFGNDHFGAIMGYGDYVISDSVISRVYYVEGLGYNLFSVGQFCDSDLEVAFRKHSCYVCDTDGVELLKGSHGSNLYTISVEDMMKSSLICLLSKASKHKLWLWHQRLNHLNFGTINDLARKDLVRGLPRLKFEKDHLCSACQLRKSKKHTHTPKPENTNLEVLNTLHMDLCGPMRVQTINGKKYILVIVDDYSRFMWVKFLRSKDETPMVVIKFLKQIQVSLNKTIRFIRTDNGTEFVNKTLYDYYESVGIFHQKIVPRTP